MESDLYDAKIAQEIAAMEWGPNRGPVPIAERPLNWFERLMSRPWRRSRPL